MIYLKCEFAGEVERSTGNGGNFPLKGDADTGGVGGGKYPINSFYIFFTPLFL